MTGLRVQAPKSCGAQPMDQRHLRKFDGEVGIAAVIGCRDGRDLESALPQVWRGFDRYRTGAAGRCGRHVGFEATIGRAEPSLGDAACSMTVAKRTTS